MILLTARLGSNAPDVIRPGLVLHEGNAISPPPKPSCATVERSMRNKADATAFNVADVLRAYR